MVTLEICACVNLSFSCSGYKSKGLYSLEVYNYMTIEKYVSGIGEKIKNASNYVAGVFSKDSLKSGARAGLVGVLALGVAGLNSGCVTPAGKRLGQGLVKSGIRAHVVRSAENQSDAQYAQKIDEARQGHRNQANPVEHKRELVVQYWKDFNGDGKLSEGENLGDIDKPIDFNKYNIRVKLESTSDAPITFFALDSDDNRVAFLEKDAWKSWINGSSEDWIGNLHKVGREKADKYTIYVRQQGCSKILKKTITTIRNKNNFSTD